MTPQEQDFLDKNAHISDEALKEDLTSAVAYAAEMRNKVTTYESMSKSPDQNHRKMGATYMRGYQRRLDKTEERIATLRKLIEVREKHVAIQG